METESSKIIISTDYITENNLHKSTWLFFVDFDFGCSMFIIICVVKSWHHNLIFRLENYLFLFLRRFAWNGMGPSRCVPNFFYSQPICFHILFNSLVLRRFEHQTDFVSFVVRCFLISWSDEFIFCWSIAGGEAKIEWLESDEKGITIFNWKSKISTTTTNKTKK